MTEAPLVDVGYSEPVRLDEPGALLGIAMGRTREEIEIGGIATTVAFGALALSECWPSAIGWPARKRPGRWRPGQPIAVRGQEIFDDLDRALRGKVKRSALLSICLNAHNWAVTAGLSEDDVQQAEAFCDPPAGD